MDLDICRRSNKWKSLVNEEEMTSLDLEFKHKISYFNIMLNHRSIQKFELMSCGKYNLISILHACACKIWNLNGIHLPYCSFICKEILG